MCVCVCVCVRVSESVSEYKILISKIRNCTQLRVGLDTTQRQRTLLQNNGVVVVSVSSLQRTIINHIHQCSQEEGILYTNHFVVVL